jgi:hypothetical protein
MTGHSVHNRRGLMLVAVIVCLTIASAILLSAVKQFALAKRSAELHHRQQQAAWLVEAGLERAAAGLKQTGYTGETWTISAADLGGLDDAAVEIAVSQADDAQGDRKVDVTARYPAGEYGMSVSKSVVINLETKGSP